MSHTPGPWIQHGSTVYSPDNGNVCVVTEIHTGVIGSPPIGISSDDWKEAMENARLIAAAPDLLEACRRALKDEEQSRDLHDGGGLDDETLEALRAAIAKAEEK